MGECFIRVFNSFTSILFYWSSRVLTLMLYYSDDLLISYDDSDALFRIYSLLPQLQSALKLSEPLLEGVIGSSEYEKSPLCLSCLSCSADFIITYVSPFVPLIPLARKSNYLVIPFISSWYLCSDS